jgi:hypothetical protein
MSPTDVTLYGVLESKHAKPSRKSLLSPTTIVGLIFICPLPVCDPNIFFFVAPTRTVVTSRSARWILLVALSVQ